MQKNNNFEVNDTVYIYVSSPFQKIQFKTRVTQTNILFEGIKDDKKYWLNKKRFEDGENDKYVRLELIEAYDTGTLSLPYLLRNGLNSAPQSPIHLTGELLNYIETADASFFRYFLYQPTRHQMAKIAISPQ